MLASYGELSIGEARRSAWRLGRRLSLPPSRELTLLYWAFAGVIVVLALYAYEYVVGALR